MFACLHGQGNLTALAFEFSPTVERTAEGTVVLDASGLDRLFGLPQDVAAALARRAAEVRVKANIALAANPDAAICAARGFAGVSVIPQGDEGKFLGTLPLAVLAPPPELQETLERWGIRRFQELAALPPLGIAERLGPEGLRLRELARGEAERRLMPLEEPLHFEDELELEYPVYQTARHDNPPLATAAREKPVQSGAAKQTSGAQTHALDAGGDSLGGDSMGAWDMRSEGSRRSRRNYRARTR